jgi:hypothetical protein
LREPEASQSCSLSINHRPAHISVSESPPQEDGSTEDMEINTRCTTTHCNVERHQATRKSKHMEETLPPRRSTSHKECERSIALKGKRFYRGWANASLCAHVSVHSNEGLGRVHSHYYIDCHVSTHWGDITFLTTGKSSPSGLDYDRGFTDNTRDAVATGMDQPSRLMRTDT